MLEEEFEKILSVELKKIDIEIEKEKLKLFYKYMKVLLEWNEKINLTAITDEKEIILKHFIDSLTINKYIKKEDIVMDMGTGAGFPGIPLKIINADTKFILVDSLNKRINFLTEVKEKLKLEKLDLLHARAEDLGNNAEYREKMDVVVSRAVANLRTLTEYTVPFVKKGGIFISMKGPNVQEEIELAQNAIEILGGKIEKVENFKLADMERNIIVIRKEKVTPKKYPRKAGIPAKQPI